MCDFKHTMFEHLPLGFNYLPPAAQGRGWGTIKRLPYVRPSICLSNFYINLNISFIYKDIFTKFAGNVYGYENLPVQNFGPDIAPRGSECENNL